MQPPPDEMIIFHCGNCRWGEANPIDTDPIYCHYDPPPDDGKRSPVQYGEWCRHHSGLRKLAEDK